MAKKNKPKLKVVLDTNVIFTGASSELLRPEVVDLINTHKTIADIEILWFLPETVVKERNFQMNKKGKELLPSLNKIEKLLGHNLNITSEIIEARVHDAIQKEIAKYSLKIITLDTAKVQWNELVERSVKRLPPFEDNDKEKGFRDALILESLKQLVADSPKTISACRVVLVTADKLLATAAVEYFTDKNNCKVLSSLEDLTSYINVLGSSITEEFINKIKVDAGKLFFIKENKETLYYKEEIREKVGAKFSTELSSLPVGATSRTNGTWYISNPGFEKKTNQRVYWKSVIEVECTAKKIESEENSRRLNDMLLSRDKSNQGSILNYMDAYRSLTAKSLFLEATAGSQPLPDSYFLPNYGLPQQKETIVSEGRTKLKVLWSVTVNTKKKLTKAKIEGIEFIETIWQ